MREGDGPGPARGRGALAELARRYEVQTSYTDMRGRRRVASSSSLLSVLRAMGAPVEDMGDVPGALRSRRLDQWRCVLEPVTVAWDGRLRDVVVRVPASAAGRRPRAWMVPEDGQERPIPVVENPRAGARTSEVEGVPFVELRLASPQPLPLGYHRLRLTMGKVEGRSLVVAAPHGRDGGDDRRSWGVFLPLYALRSERSWGTADFTDLEALLRWVGGLGGTVAATLPLLAAFLDEPFEASPYSPASRLFWNELYLDVDRIPELGRSGEARALMGSEAFRDRLARARSGSLVDYREAYALKRPVLEALARTFFAEPSARTAVFRRYVRENPAVEDYARFRATCERHRRVWMEWPASEREGVLARRAATDDDRRYHLYVQWLSDQQLEAVDHLARGAGAGLYFDLPVGVNPAGYDVWRERRAFLFGASAGAPPDPFFTGGQDWGFPPLHPQGIREQGYRYVIASLRHLLRRASVLRIDHVMGLHRIFVIPEGAPGTRGVYVRYRPEELYAILALEARRHEALIVGEDLGVVPTSIRHALARHGVYRSYVLQMELRPDPRAAIRPPPRDAMASMNTHDLSPFAAFWTDADVTERVRAGVQDEASARADLAGRTALRAALVEYLRATGHLRDRRPGGGAAGSTARRGRRPGGAGGGREGAPGGERAPEPDARAVLDGCLAHLGEGPAKMVVVNVEDLWMETRPQNVPGTVDEYPNWRRRARYPLERLRTMPRVVRSLRDLNARRNGGPA